jgi:hypothetical protein
LLWMNAATGAAMIRIGWGIVFLYLISFFWTQQVIQNIVHVVVASVLGTWWHNPAAADACWGSALNDGGLVQATSYSLGSIAFGSLVAGFVQALKYLNRMARSRNKCSCVVCCIDCLLSCVQSITEYFNKWAYTYRTLAPTEKTTLLLERRRLLYSPTEGGQAASRTRLLTASSD